jgi:DNA-directed RNA polymerase II subunit RPB2
MDTATSDKEFYEKTWTVLDRFFDDTPYYVTRHHLDSFNRFLRDGIHAAVRTMNYPQFRMAKSDRIDGRPVEYDVAVYVGGKDGDKLYLDKPTMTSAQDSQARPLYPNEARLKSLTYASNLYADVLVEYTTTTPKNESNKNEKNNEKNTEKENNTTTTAREFKAVRLCSLPIMLHSASCYLNGCSKAVLREMGECPYDMGGYFVVDGLEKVIIAQERTAYNRLFTKHVRMSNPDARYEMSLVAYIRCMEETKSLFPWIVNFGVLSDRVSGGKRKDAMVVKIPRLSSPVRLFHLFRALGVESDRAIMELICNQCPESERPLLARFLVASVRDAAGVFTQAEAAAALAALTDYGTRERLKLILVDNFLPNAPDDFAAKAVYLAYLVAETARVALGLQEQSQYDHYAHKRLHLSGFMVSDMFRDMYVRFVRMAKARLDQAYFYGPWKNSGKIENLVNASNLSFIFDAASMDAGIFASFKGRWNYDSTARPGQETAHTQEGVIQDLNRVSYQLYLSYVRRIDVDFDRALKIVDPHLLRGSHWGCICPVESPDGPSVGLLKHLALLAHVSFPVDHAPLLAYLSQTQRLIRLSAMHSSSAKVFINDTWHGSTTDAHELVAHLRGLRRRGALHPTTSLTLHAQRREVRISTTGGRFCRPLYIVDRDPEAGRSRVRISQAVLEELARGRRTWHQLVNGENAGDALGSWPEGALRLDAKVQTQSTRLDDEAAIEYVDVEETETLLIATSPADLFRNDLLRYSHCEIHACSIFSMASSIIPLLHHNNAAYNSLALAQTKQAIGVYATNFANRFDVAGMILNSPQVPLVTSRFAEKTCDGRLMHGENLIVAIASYTGYNQDDGCIVNADSAMRGMFNVSYYSTLRFEEDEYGAEKIVIANPMVLAQGRAIDGLKDAGAYAYLDEAGHAKPGTLVREGMIICGRVHVRTELEAGDLSSSSSDLIAKTQVRRHICTDRSEVADRSMEGMIVDRVFSFARHGTGQRCIKVRMRRVRTPELGDKIASRFAQKGVVGILLRREDMPFSASGVVPDLILNPNAFPKRMTVGHLLDCILSKTCAMAGTRMCHNPFEPKDVHGISATLEQRYGLHRHGDEILYSGFTGVQLDCAIFMGPTYTGRLKHMVADKMNFRDKGPVNFLTRQPTKGRGKHGGLRVGEMEEHVLLAHGVASFLKESFMERADGYQMVVNADQGTTSDVVVNPSAKLCTVLDASRNSRDGRDHLSMESVSTEFANVAVPYAFKLMQQELQAMSIDTRMHFHDDTANEASYDGFDDDDEKENDDEDSLKYDDAGDNIELHDVGNDMP